MESYRGEGPLFMLSNPPGETTMRSRIVGAVLFMAMLLVILTAFLSWPGTS
jgi:hypothetical protein